MSDKDERIRQRAYEKWQKEGEAHGWHDRHWAEAEREISSEDEKTASPSGIAADETSAASVTPMMDDAGMPSDNEIKSDAGASAAAAAVAGVAPGKRRSSGGKSSPRKKGKV